MFLYSLSIFVNFLFLNSGAQEAKSLSSEQYEHRKIWEVPQEIKDLVPVHFAVSNLRESRLKNEIDRNVSNQVIDEVEKPSKFGASRGDAKIGNARKTSKKSKKIKFTPVRKYLRPRTGSTKKCNTTTSLPGRVTTVQPEETTLDVDTENPESELLLKMGVKSAVSANSHAFIQKAINALPEELVKVITDNDDCNDEMEKRFADGRGSPPCVLSQRWSGSSGDLWLSPRNITNRNWQIPIN